jgi:hypothetical protein
MSYTSLHRSVGALPGRVTAAMLQQAVDAKLGESDDLDWKQDGNDLKENRELAKDFAAFANAAGGIIVTGVTENGTGKADGLPGVDDARAQALANKFRGIANSSRCRPSRVTRRSSWRCPEARSPRTWSSGTRRACVTRGGLVRTPFGWVSPRWRPRIRGASPPDERHGRTCRISPTNSNRTWSPMRTGCGFSLPPRAPYRPRTTPRRP